MMILPHDGALGFGLMCIHYDQPETDEPERERYRGRRISAGSGESWQSA
ncbi:hypothetical protein [Bradyrhizobium lablabi]|nr:hypothetical protein [Bradyrhizobium lablabi]